MSVNLELRGIRKAFGDFVAVDRVSLAVPPGAIFGLLGQNGAGKTTTIRMIMDIIAPDEGEVLLFGRRREENDGRRVGYLPEERGLYRKMTVQDQLLFLAELNGMKRSIAVAKIAEWLEKVELASWAKAKTETLSKGMQQKIQLVGTVIHDPEILILDEPFSGLDPINQGLFKDLLADFQRRGKTILFSTHILEQAEKLCSHVALIAHGKIILDGDLAELKRERGGNVFRVEATGDWSKLGAIPGVDQIMGDGPMRRLFLAAGANPGAVLRRLAAELEVSSFRSEVPDLETIFVQAVRNAN